MKWLSEFASHNGGYNILVLLLALGGAAIAIWRAYNLDKQRKISDEQVKNDKQRLHNEEQRLHTDSYIRAVEQLGAVKKDENDKTKKNFEVRLGGIYGLGRIAKESKTHRRQIIELLCAYIVENASGSKPDEQKPPPADILAILDIIEDNRKEWEKWEGFQPNLQHVNFQSMDLSDRRFEGFDFRSAKFKKAKLFNTHLEKATLHYAHLEKADIYYAHLEEARLNFAHLEGANLLGTHLEEAHLKEAHLEGADLTHAHLEGADFEGAHLEENMSNFDNSEAASLNFAHLEEANLLGANLEGVSLLGANLAAARMAKTKKLTQKQIDGAFGDSATELPEDLKAPPHWPKVRLASKAEGEWQKWLNDPENYRYEPSQ